MSIIIKNKLNISLKSPKKVGKMKGTLPDFKPRDLSTKFGCITQSIVALHACASHLYYKEL